MIAKELGEAMHKVMNKIIPGIIGSGVLMGSAFDALAGAPVGVPGPLAGIGLPALAVGAGAYWIVKRFYGNARGDRVSRNASDLEDGV